MNLHIVSLTAIPTREPLSADARKLREAVEDSGALGKLLRWAQVDLAASDGKGCVGVLRGRGGPAFGTKKR